MRVNNSRYMVKMELRAKSADRQYDDFENSAHQFSVRSKSIQADSEERNEIALQTEMIDLKNMDQQVDIYDLQNKRDAKVGESEKEESEQGMFKETKDMGTMMEPNRRLLVSQDWFFSILYRQLLKKFYANQNSEVPEALLNRFKRHDEKNEFKPFEDLRKSSDNPQAMTSSWFNMELSESEISYQIQLFKGNRANKEDMSHLKLLHARCTFTAKSMTKKTVESSQPITNILGKHESVNDENVILLLYRLHKMCAAKADATKILEMYLKLEHDPKTQEMSLEKQTTMWNRFI